MHTKRKRLWIRFDQQQRVASRQHYFHFLLGYLLPSLAFSLDEPAVEQTVFVSCGPVMDARIREAAHLLGLRFIITQEDLIPDCWRETTLEVLASRWDLWLMHDFPTRLTQTKGAIVLDIGRIRHQLLSAAAALPGASWPGGDWLLLRRSAPPDFYRKGGPAERATYGSGRRAIADIDGLAAALAQAGFPVRIYEPGARSLQDQISTFASAAGVIGIRGAEFANLLWMQPGSQAVMLGTPLKKENHASRNLASLMGIHFYLVPVASRYPQVEASMILDALGPQLLDRP